MVGASEAVSSTAPAIIHQKISLLALAALLKMLPSDNSYGLIA